MPKAENLFKVLQLGTRLKQLKMQEEERVKAKEDEERFLESISDNPDLVRAYRLSKGFNLPAEKVFQLSGLMTPAQKEERKTKEMVGELAHIKSVSGVGTLKHMLERPETPPETKGRMLGLTKTFPSLKTGYEEPQLKEEEAGKALRIQRGLKPRAGIEQVTESEKARYWLGRSATETPLGWKNQFLKKGYVVKNDLWMPGPTLQENMLRDPRFSSLYNLKEKEVAVRLGQEGKVFSAEHVPMVWREALDAYWNMMDVTAGMGVEGQEFIDETVGEYGDLIK